MPPALIPYPGGGPLRGQKAPASGLKDGEKIGVKKGVYKGKIEKAKEMAKEMKKNKEPIDKISKYTGLSKKEIEKL